MNTAISASSPTHLIPPAGPTGSAGTGGRSPRLGRTALALVVGGLVVALAASALAGLAIGPAEAAHGRYLSDTPAAFQQFLVAMGGAVTVGAVLGAVGAVLAIIDVVRRGWRRATVIALALAVAGPILTVGVMILALLIGGAAVIW